MPKRIIKNNVKPKVPPTFLKSTDGQDTQEFTEAELKFDQEVLWCISQFEKLIDTGKLPEPKSKLERLVVKYKHRKFISSLRTRKYQSNQHAEKTRSSKNSENSTHENPL